MSSHWELGIRGAQRRPVRVSRGGQGATVWVDGQGHRCAITPVGGRHELVVGDRTETVWVAHEGDSVHIHAFGRAWHVEVADPRVREGRGVDGDDLAMAPMPGMVLQITVEAGDAVAAGQVLMVIESMKMQSEIVAVRDGLIERVLVAEGDSFDRGAGLVALAASDEEQD